MPSFKDSNNKEWSVTLDAPTIRVIRKELDGIDLADLDGKAYERLVDDPCLLVDVLWVLCREQAEKVGITDVQFGKSLTGDAIDRATAAMLAAIADFFPKQKRELLTALAAKSDKIQSMGMAKAMAKLNDPNLEQQMLAAMEEKMDAEIKKVLTRLSSRTNTPDSAESPPEG